MLIVPIPALDNDTLFAHYHFDMDNSASSFPIEDEKRRSCNNLLFLSDDDLEPIPIRQEARADPAPKQMSAIDLEPTPIREMKQSVETVYPTGSPVAKPTIDMSKSLEYTSLGDQLLLPQEQQSQQQQQQQQQDQQRLKTQFESANALSFLAGANLANPALFQATTSMVDQGVPGPSNCDVVCARGKHFQSLPGSVRFRRIVHQAIPEYVAATSRVDKSAIINSIIQTSLNHESFTVRFLKYHPKTRTWSELGYEQIRDKVGHALREAISEMERMKKRQRSNA